MKKTINKVLITGLGLALGFGVFSFSNANATEVRAGESNASSCDFTTKSAGANSYGSEWSYGDFKVYGGANNSKGWDYVKFGAKKAKSTDADKVTNGYVISPKIASSIKRIDMVLLASSTKVENAVCSWYVDVATKADFSDATSTTAAALTHATAGTYSITPTTAWDANMYYKVHLDVTNKTTSNGVLWVSKINLVTESSSPVELESISAEPISILPGGSVKPTITFNPSDADDKTVSYAITAGSDVASVASDGTVTGLKAGSATLTITPNDTNASPIDVAITVNAFPAIEGVSVGKKYIIVANGYEFSSFESNYVATTAYTGSPMGILKFDVVDGYYANTVAFKNESNYLEYHGTSNALYTVSSLTPEASWTVAIEGDNGLIVRNAIDRSRLIAINSSTNKANCYTNLDQNEISFVEYVDGISLTSFTIDETLDVKVGLTETIIVEYNPSNASDKTLTWSSSNESVATVSNGVVTGVSTGTATITASKDGLTSQTCSVTVTNLTEHAGTVEDPYTVADAVAVAKSPNASKTGKYVRGIVTKFISGATASSCSFWVGDNTEQISAATGGFEFFKLANITTDAFKLIKVGATVIASGDITYYNNVTPEFSSGGTLTYNSYAVANEFAKAFNTGVSEVCTVTQNDLVGTAAADLVDFFNAQAISYATLADVEKAHFTINAKTGDTATDLEKMLATYDYCLSKYTNLNNFVARESSQGQSALLMSQLRATNNMTVVIVVLAVTSISLVGVLVVLKKRKVNSITK